MDARTIATPPAESAAASGHAVIESMRKPGDFTTNPRVLVISAIAVVIGSFGVLTGVLLLNLIRLCTNLAYFGRFSLANLPLSRSPLGLLAVGIPVLGALIVGLMARYGSEKIRGHGIPEAIEAILLGRSRLDWKVAILKPLSSAVAIGTGGPFGAEGPIIMTGGAVGSLIAQALPVSDTERKTLLVAGAAAGMTTVFGTPIAAIMLAVELLLFEWTPRSFVPVAVAAIIADVERSAIGLPSPLFPFHGAMAPSALGLGSWVLIGLLSGLLSGLLTRLVYACEDAFLKLPIHWMFWPMLGGVAVGLGGLLEPQALGVGYDNIARMLGGGVLPPAALLLLVVKAVIWAVALGSGTSGGVLAPLLIMGGALGTALAPFLPPAGAGFWALLAMCATMGGTMRSPLTATFFAVELTGNTHVLLPLITACVTAHLLTVLLMRRSILTEKVARRGHHLAREYRVDPFTLTRVREVMVTDVQTLPAEMTLHEAAAFLTDPRTRHPSFPVIDAERRVLGLVNPPAVLRWRRSGAARRSTLRDLLGSEPLATAFADEYLDTIVERMMARNVAQLPVVARADRKLLGVLGWKDVLKVRARLAEEEASRTAFYQMSRRGVGSRRATPTLQTELARPALNPRPATPDRSIGADDTGGAARNANISTRRRGIVASPEGLKELYLEEMGDLWSANDQMQGVVGDLIGKASDQKLKALLQKSETVIAQHTQSLRSVLESAGGSVGKEHCKGMEGIVAEARRYVVEAAPTDPTLRDLEIIAQYQRMSHYGLAGFGTAAAYAEALGRAEDATKLKGIISDIYKADEYSTQLAAAAQRASTGA